MFETFLELLKNFQMDYPPILPLSANSKYIELENCFKLCFGSPPHFYARVPGRVNLIGEHIDYCGFAVLPMALEQDIVMAVKTNRTSTLNLVNLDSDVYQSFSSPVSKLDVDKSAPKWHHYFICGYKGISEKYQLDQTGLDVLVQGTIPPSSGLSSSSALVCASALITSYAHRIFLTKMEIAALCAVCERYIGTEGGGMDQAIGFLAESGTAKLIEFNPLRTVNVPLPEEVVFVVSNSGVVMNKAATCQFNIRVIECRLAAKVLAKAHGLDWRSIQKLAEIPALLGKDIFDMKSIVETSLKQKSYSRADLCSILGITNEEFVSILSQNTSHLEHFQLVNRALHVYQEAARVQQFKKICEVGGSATDLGHLMNESHASCRDLYECSHPVLDELVEISLHAGALGSRLTGAGWGGCCVSLVLKDHAEQFIQAVKKNFYEKKEFQCIDSAIFLTKPSSGAAIYSL